MTPFVSIIIPIYNVAEYIEKCILSIIRQTYLGRIECLLIDDNTPDDSIIIALNIIERYNGPITFRIIHHDMNKGLSAARNTGVRYASGDYVFFLDSDDYIYPDCIHSLVETLSKFPQSEIVIGGADSSLQSCNLEKKMNDLPPFSDDVRWIRKTFLTRGQLPITAWNKLILKDFLIKNNLFFMEGVLNEDEHFNFIIAKKLSKVSFCFRNTYFYNQREGSIMTSNNALSKQKSLLLICNDMISKLEQKTIPEEFVYIFHILLDLRYSEYDCISSEAIIALKHLCSRTSLFGMVFIYIIIYFPKVLTQHRFVYLLSGHIIF